MYDRTTWADIQRYESSDDYTEGPCDWCGVTGWLALYGTDDICTDCEAEEYERLEKQRFIDSDDGIVYEDDI
jgi:hypothetical protein